MLNIRTLAIFNLSCFHIFYAFPIHPPKQHIVLFWAIKIKTLWSTFYTSKMGYGRQFYIQNKIFCIKIQFLGQPIFPSSKMGKTIQMYYKHRSCYTNTFIILHVILKKVSSILIRIVRNIFCLLHILYKTALTQLNPLLCVCVFSCSVMSDSL